MQRNIDAQIMQYRALGYSQSEIAKMLGVAQSTISQRLESIYNMSKSENPQQLFWNLLLGGIGIALLIKILDELNKG